MLRVVSEGTPPSNPLFNDNADSDDDELPSHGISLHTSLRHRGTRVRTASVRYRYAAYVAPSHDAFAASVRSNVQVFPVLHHSLVISTSVIPDPKAIADAISANCPDADQWKVAIANEF